LTRQVALLSLVPMVLLGVVLARVLQSQVVARTLSDESRSARLIARIGIQPRLTPHDLRAGLGADGVRRLDELLRSPSVKRELARIKVWNDRDQVIYSDDHSLIGRTFSPSDDLEHALEGHPAQATVVDPRLHSETAGEVGLGRLIEVYVPLRFGDRGRPAGAFEMYLSYRPVAGAISADKRTVVLLIAVGLGLLWLILYRIVARASRRLRHQSEENDRLARFDQLTGLPNRTLFRELLDERLRSGGPDSELAVCVVDLDRFNEINSTLGPATGDRVLRAVASRLDGALGERALVARLGNDEFAIFCANPGGASGAAGIATVVQRALAPEMVLDGVSLSVEASIAVALRDRQAIEATEMLQRAEAALARGRRTGTRITEFSAELDRFDPAKLLLLGQVRGGLERGEFVLQYQPKLELATGRIVGAEALVRWRHPELGLLAPGDFMPLIEPTALVGPLALYVVDRAAAWLAATHRRGADPQLAVNLSAMNLLDDGLPAELFRILRNHRISPDRFTFEVTESATMTDPAKAIAVLEAIRAGGARVSIDDFGTGHASIDYLARLPADEIKIDRSFITGICADARAEAIVRSMIELARHLELAVVAEGIETAAALERVSALGCDLAQGYLIARPLDGDQLAATLARAQSQPPSGRTSPRRERSAAQANR